MATKKQNSTSSKTTASKKTSTPKSTSSKSTSSTKESFNQLKMEAANEVGVTLKNGYNGNLTSAQAGSIGGQMVKKMVEKYENSHK